MIDPYDLDAITDTQKLRYLVEYQEERVSVWWRRAMIFVLAVLTGWFAGYLAGVLASWVAK